MSKKVLIVGGVAGGATAAARLRRLDEECEIIMFEKGEYISFANCGLPYYVGGEIKEKSKLTLQTPESFNSRFNVDVRINNEVTGIDTSTKSVTVKDTKSGEDYKESYDKLILSPGATPIKPKIEGIENDRVFTLRNIPDTYTIKDFIDNNNPKSAVVVGGGYIGVEMAENLNARGIKVYIVEMLDQVIAPLDYDMACDVHSHIKSKGVELVLSKAVTKIEDNAGGLEVSLDDGQVINADMLVMSIGVRPDSKIALDAGLECNERGAIIVNESMQTSNTDIYAAGDAVEVVDFVTGRKAMIPLAGPANKQGRICADNICGIDSKYTGTQGSAILKVFDMTVATTGINEKTAKKQGLDYDKVFLYLSSHAGYYPGAVNMSIKVVYENKTGKILGAQLTGYDGTDKRCDVFATAIRFGATYKELKNLELCYAPPYSSAKDPVNVAGLVIENLITGKVKGFHWHEIKELKDRKDVTLLDTRTVMEYESGSIEGFINIPLDELRARLSELDKSKPVYVHCQTGLRSYVACRILSQNGFDCYNLNGGYRLYNSIFGSEVKSNNKEVIMDTETQRVELVKSNKVISVDACGLQCPGPIIKLGEALQEIDVNDTIEISTTDPAFASDIEGFCRRTGHEFGGMKSEKGVSMAIITKRSSDNAPQQGLTGGTGKNIIVFSGDLDKAIASFIMANAAAAMGRKVSMFFTFWGLNILRKGEGASVKKDLISKMFGSMMPRGSQKLSLSKMNMGGMGAKMIRHVMKSKNIDSLEDLIKQSQKNGVELVACSMSMDVMGIKQEELIDGVKLGGAAAMLAFAEESDMSLFVS